MPPVVFQYSIERSSRVSTGVIEESAEPLASDDPAWLSFRGGLRSRYTAGVMTEPWHEKDQTWEALAPVLFTRRRWERAETEVGLLGALLGLTGDEQILDMPCGTGRHSIELARCGYRATGVDRTEAYLAEARRRAEAGGVTVEWVRADMRSFSRPQAFDVVLNLYTSFGYFEDTADDKLAARAFFDALRPGGRLLMELFGRENLAAGFQSRAWTELDDGLLLLEERAITDHWRRVHNRWIMIQDTRRHEIEFSLRLYSAGELIDLLSDVGFTDVTAFGNLDGDPYDEHARRLVIVATK